MMAAKSKMVDSRMAKSKKFKMAAKSKMATKSKMTAKSKMAAKSKMVAKSKIAAKSNMTESKMANRHDWGQFRGGLVQKNSTQNYFLNTFLGQIKFKFST